MNYGKLEKETAYFISSDEAKLISLRNQLLCKHDQNSDLGTCSPKHDLQRQLLMGRGLQTPEAPPPLDKVIGVYDLTYKATRA